MKHSKYLMIVLLSLITTACSPPDERYFVVNESNENLEITYRSDVCISPDNEGYWQPKLYAKDANDEQAAEFPTENIEVKTTKEEITGYAPDGQSPPKIKCEKKTYRLQIPANHTARIYLGKYQGFRSDYLQLKNSNGTITYEGKPILIENTFTKERLTPLTGTLNSELHYR